MEMCPKILKRETMSSCICSLHFSMSSSKRHTSETKIKILELLLSFKVFGQKSRKYFKKEVGWGEVGKNETKQTENPTNRKPTTNNNKR